jgi:hypothetical protein
MEYTIELSVLSFNDTYRYKTKFYYSKLIDLKQMLDFFESTFDSDKAQYQIPKPMYEYIASEDMYVGSHSFSITALFYGLSLNGFLFVQVKKTLLKKLIGIV